MSWSESAFHQWINYQIPSMCMSENPAISERAKKIYKEYIQCTKYPSKYPISKFREKYMGAYK